MLVEPHPTSKLKILEQTTLDDLPKYDCTFFGKVPPIVMEYVNVLLGGVPHSLSTERTRMFNDFSRKELVHHPIDSQPFESGGPSGSRKLLKSLAQCMFKHIFYLPLFLSTRQNYYHWSRPIFQIVLFGIVEEVHPLLLGGSSQLVRG